jgi:stage V sporulation protein D (sporulation-specific penicillin-binding protein)
MRTRYQKKFSLRLRWLFYVFLPLVALVLLINLFHIQVNNGSSFRERADDQYVVASYNAFERGNIYFQEKDGDLITAAGQKKGYKVSVNASSIDNPDAFLADIQEVIELEDPQEVLNRLSSGRSYQEILFRLSEEEGLALKEALGRRISLHSEKWRVYPLNSIASHVLGFMAFQGDDFAGRYGLERSYEKTLVRNNQDLYTNFFARVFHGVQDIVDEETDSEGDIITTIEPQVQIFLEAKLKEIHDRWDSERTGAIIIHPQTGDVYAMATTPSFDPNDFSQESIEVFKNPMIENVYELGSILKPLVVAAAWDAGDITENTTYNDTGSVVVGPHRIFNFDKKGRGLVDVQKILEDSLNTGMVYISQRMQKDDFRDYFAKYGFGEQTGIDLPNEGKGLTSNLKSNRDIEFANMSFGQGIAITPISMVSAASALANEGKTIVPRIVERVNYENGFFNNFEVQEGQQVISPETASEVSRMLVNVFDAYNDGRTMIPNYSVAAKTGTAQIPAPDGGYYDDRNLHSFVGYFPAYDPEFMVFFYTIHPKGVRFASQTLLSPFRDTAQYLINYYDVPPDR